MSAQSAGNERTGYEFFGTGNEGQSLGNLEAWGKETSNIISLKKNEKAEKYYINEGTN